jgi:hypothetical protein
MIGAKVVLGVACVNLAFLSFEIAVNVIKAFTG